MNSALTLESSLESRFVKWVESQGYDAIKINKRSWPDRLITLNCGYGFYIEFKRTGRINHLGQYKGEKHQDFTRKKILLKGTHVYVVENIAQAKEIFQHELYISQNIPTFEAYKV